MIFWQATGKHPGLYLSKETLLPLLNRCPALKATALIWKCSCRPTKETGMTTKRLYLEPLWNVRNSQLIEILTDWTSQRKSNGASMYLREAGRYVQPKQGHCQRRWILVGEFFAATYGSQIPTDRRCQVSLPCFRILLHWTKTSTLDCIKTGIFRPQHFFSAGKRHDDLFVCLFLFLTLFLFLLFVCLYLFVSHAILHKSWSCRCKSARTLIQPSRGATTTTYNHNRILYLFGTIGPHSLRVICTCTWRVHFRGIAWTLWPSNNEHVLQHTTTYA